MNAEETTETLWTDFSDGLWRFIRARVASDADADDVLQDVFLKVHRRHTELRDTERVAGWLFRIASTSVVDHHRCEARHEAPPTELAPSPVEPATLDVDVEKLLATCIKPFVEQLPPIYRDAVARTELEGLTQQEAADETGISLSGMKSRVQRGRAQLRESLERCCDVTLDSRNRIVEVEPICSPNTCIAGPECDAP